MNYLGIIIVIFILIAGFWPLIDDLLFIINPKVKRKRKVNVKRRCFNHLKYPPQQKMVLIDVKNCDICTKKEKNNEH